MFLEIPKIPFLVAPYPDEILGSWLFRLGVHNIPSFIASLVTRLIGRNLKTAGWRDIVAPTPQVDRFFGVLGTSYVEVMMTLTTYPYWLRFHSSKNCQPNEPSTFVNGIPDIVFDNRVSSFSRINCLSPGVVRLCPECLLADTKKYGEPYLHRAHHVPFAAICHIHGGVLISRCPDCGQIFRMKSTLINAIIKCTCGCDLSRHRSERLTNHEHWVRFSEYCANVLMSKQEISSYTDFNVFFDFKLNQQGIKNRRVLVEYFSEIYGPTAAKAIMTNKLQKSEKMTYSLIGTVCRHELRAPQICAFLAAVDMSFDKTQKFFFSSKDVLPAQPILALQITLPDTRPKIPLSVSDARRHVFELQQTADGSSTRSNIYKRYKTLFWYLVLFDKEWFNGNYPPATHGATEIVPSIAADRLSIEEAIRRAESPSVRIWKNLAQQAFFRAMLRDIAWLNEKKTETAVIRKRLAALRIREQLDACKRDMAHAVERIRCLKGEHARVSLEEISTYTAANISQLKYVKYASTPDKKVGEANRLVSGETNISLKPCCVSVRSK